MIIFAAVRHRIAIIIALLLALPLFGQEQWAVVDVANCYLRARPDYESGLESQALMGTVVKVGEADRYWRKVSTPDYKDVWTNELVLAYVDEAGRDRWLAAPKWICTARYAILRQNPSDSALPVCDLTMGNLLERLPDQPEGEWVLAATPSGRKGYLRRSEVCDFRLWASSRKPSRESIVMTALQFKGVPYLWGGIGVKGFDCSGFTKFVYLMNGIVLRRNAREQIESGEIIPYDLAQMEPGDLIFFGRKASEASRKPSVTHVAIYIGGGRIIHSSQLVRINSLLPGESDYYQKEIVGVRRMLDKAGEDPGVVPILQDPWYFGQ